MTDFQKLYAWPLKPGSKTSGTAVSGPVPGTRQQICRAELQADLPARPWQIVVANLGPIIADFFIELGDDFGASTSTDAAVRACIQIQDVTPFGGVPVPPSVGNFWTMTVVAKSITVYGTAIAAFTARPNLYASIAPQAASLPMVEP